MWALSFGSVFVVTILVAIVDLKNESGYMPLSEFTNGKYKWADSNNDTQF